MKNRSTPCAPQLITGASADLKPGADTPGDDRNASRVCAVRAKAYVVLGDLAFARAELARAVELAAASNADHYRAELTDLAAEIEFRDGDIAAARSRWGPC